ncbi:carbohydrate ABC transporter permease [Streptomyces microflavus]|jgi:multiple sugar transport system permease protein|uniref:Carbohydrate ABC transporter permease n=1 Tax=Streptomyces microflavus TaxID=1919 RepID=A0A6N9VAC5_STRMI|nr:MULTISPECIES: carbohydrate ABC transporter permease [Streptomyces]MBK3584520.1 carbohydrate ABC transporter permease [Streptomyces sp. MBT57]MBK5994370.1 carbohydrate ABC transporter permease [Streptomyces sp. MBT58]MBW3360594.1 carbohydrate ABC transporter permease [Streptomyces sp. 09ZI22]MDX2405051.1 carbohydrate ABC transporter permease [Streptomyces microflavus]MDX2975810.1 carbohydrate ABC transporter permease [Streptomyces sp. NRRL_B-2249]
MTSGTKNRWLSKTAVNGVLLIAALYTLFPLIWLLTAATKDAGNLLGGDVFSFEGFDLAHNLSELTSYQDGIYFRWYGNSLLYAGVGALGCSLVSVAAGYAFDKYRFRGKEKLFALVLLGVLLPSTALSLPLYLLAVETGTVNTYWAVLIPALVNPFGVYLSRIFSAGYIPDEVLEAARIDGAGELRTFWSVGLRMVMPGFVTVFLFQFTAIWNNFFLPLVMLSDKDLYPLSLGLYNWHSNANADPAFYPMVVTGSLLAVTPLIVAFVVLQRHWKAGLTAGSVK